MKRIISFIFGVALCICAVGAAEAAEQDDAIVVIEAAIASLKAQPNQFSLVVNAQGMSVVSSGSGTGMNITVTGSGTGSTTGLNVSASSGDINIAQSTANKALEEQAEKSIALLNEIKTLLQAPQVDKPQVMSRLTDFGKTYVAPVLKAVIEAVIKKKLGV